MKKLFFIFFICLAFGSCEIIFGPLTEFDKNTFNQKWAAWEAQGMVNYMVEVEVRNGSAGPAGKVRIVVEDNVITQKEIIFEQSEWIMRESVMTVSELYAYIANFYVECMKERRNGKKWDLEISMDYDSKYHYPKAATYRFAQWRTGGGGYGGTTLYLTKFKPLD